MKIKKILITFTTVLFLTALIAAAGLFTGGCNEEEECLVWGENCSQQYKLDNYGTTEIYCCSGQCADHSVDQSGYYVTCGD